MLFKCAAITLPRTAQRKTKNDYVKYINCKQNHPNNYRTVHKILQKKSIPKQEDITLK